ncbi:MAG: dTDP-4-amino-4,6-dideoxygalactose transaminase, partial [bacterium]
MMIVPYNKPHIPENALKYMEKVIENRKFSGDGLFTKKCHEWFNSTFGVKKSLLTTSCTHAIEIASLLTDIKPGDEVIMPSFTFVSTANAFVLRGAEIVFVDIRPDTMNMDENLIEQALSKKTKIIVPVHYAGVSCEMDKINEIASANDLFVVEDAAQAMMSTYKNRYPGTLGDMGCYSFHETKNYNAGEGGAILLNKNKFFEKAEIIREKGTDRAKFFRGETDKYSWVDMGSSYLPSEFNAAFLYPQLEKSQQINIQRRRLWENYKKAFLCLEEKYGVKLPCVPEHCSHNGHIFYLVMRSEEQRESYIRHMKNAGIQTTFHYVPLHS